jgi:hypothetical protein
LPETDHGVRSATGTVARATRGSDPGATLPEETRKGRRKKKGNPQFNLRGELFRMAGVDLTHRWHRCHDGDDGGQRSRMGYEQVEDREPFCFLVEAVSGQQNQWGQRHGERSHAHQQPRHHCLKDGGHYSTGERQLFGGRSSADSGLGWGLRWRSRPWPPNSPGSSTACCATE